MATSRAQKVIARSSAAAEIHAAFSTTCDGIFLRVCIEFCTQETILLKIIEYQCSQADFAAVRSRTCPSFVLQHLVDPAAVETKAVGTMCHSEKVVKGQNAVLDVWW